MKLYLDEDSSSRALAKALRIRGIDLLDIHDTDLFGVPDEDQLTFAAQNQRTIFTFNVRDFVILHTQWIEQGKSHSGIIVSQQLSVGTIIQRISRLAHAKSALEMQDSLEFLSNWR